MFYKATKATSTRIWREMSGKTFDPNSKKEASSTPQTALKARGEGHSVFVRGSHACKTLRNRIGCSESRAFKMQRVSPRHHCSKFDELFWEQNDRDTSAGPDYFWEHTQRIWWTGLSGNWCQGYMCRKNLKWYYYGNSRSFSTAEKPNWALFMIWHFVGGFIAIHTTRNDLISTDDIKIITLVVLCF